MRYEHDGETPQLMPKNKKIYGQRLGKYQIRNGGHFFSFRSIGSKKKNARTAMHKNSLLPGKGILQSTTMIVSQKCSPDWGKCISRTLAFLKIWNNMEKIAPNLQVRQSMFTAKKSKAFLKSYYPHIKNSSICWSFLLH